MHEILSFHVPNKLVSPHNSSEKLSLCNATFEPAIWRVMSIENDMRNWMMAFRCWRCWSKSLRNHEENVGKMINCILISVYAHPLECWRSTSRRLVNVKWRLIYAVRSCGAAPIRRGGNFFPFVLVIRCAATVLIAPMLIISIVNNLDNSWMLTNQNAQRNAELTTYFLFCFFLFCFFLFSNILAV